MKIEYRLTLMDFLRLFVSIRIDMSSFGMGLIIFPSDCFEIVAIIKSIERHWKQFSLHWTSAAKAAFWIDFHEIHASKCHIIWKAYLVIAFGKTIFELKIPIGNSEFHSNDSCSKTQLFYWISLSLRCRNVIFHFVYLHLIWMLVSWVCHGNIHDCARVKDQSHFTLKLNDATQNDENKLIRLWQGICEIDFQFEAANRIGKQRGKGPRAQLNLRPLFQSFDYSH